MKYEKHIWRFFLTNACVGLMLTNYNNSYVGFAIHLIGIPVFIANLADLVIVGGKQ